jgi:predicted GTPase
MGYGDKQVKDLETTINRTECDTVIIATPIDLTRIIKINKPTVRVEYDLQEIGIPNLSDVLTEFFASEKEEKPARKKKTRKVKK